MMRVGFSGKAAMVAAVLVVSASIAACGGGDAGSSSSGPASSGNSPTSGLLDSGNSSGLDIKGAPATTATASQAYSFQPAVTNTAATSGTAAAALKFSIKNPPSWAKFDSSTGKLTGTPTATQVGTYANITISVSAGTATATLPAFTIIVGEGNPQSNVTLSWQAPSENADGTPLTDLKGFKVHYGSASRIYSATIDVPNGGLTTYVVDNLTAGKYYFAVTAYNSSGEESSLSPEIAQQVD
jgi:Putative Ig domain